MAKKLLIISLQVQFAGEGLYAKVFYRSLYHCHHGHMGLIYEDALLVFYMHSTISQLSYPLHQPHQKGRNTRRSPSRFLQRGSTAPHKVKNTKKEFTTTLYVANICSSFFTKDIIANLNFSQN